MSKPKTKIVPVRLTPDLAKAVKSLADSEQATVSEKLREWVVTNCRAAGLWPPAQAQKESGDAL